MDLADQKCQPARAGLQPLSGERIAKLLLNVKSWEVIDGHLRCDFTFRNFLEAMPFVNRVAELVNAEDHYPTIQVFYKTVRIDLFTHAVNGLGENDFILATKIDRLVQK